MMNEQIKPVVVAVNFVVLSAGDTDSVLMRHIPDRNQEASTAARYASGKWDLASAGDYNPTTPDWSDIPSGLTRHRIELLRHLGLAADMDPMPMGTFRTIEPDRTDRIKHPRDTIRVYSWGEVLNNHIAEELQKEGYAWLERGRIAELRDRLRRPFPTELAVDTLFYLRDVVGRGKLLNPIFEITRVAEDPPYLQEYAQNHPWRYPINV